MEFLRRNDLHFIFRRICEPNRFSKSVRIYFADSRENANLSTEEFHNNKSTSLDLDRTAQTLPTYESHNA